MIAQGERAVVRLSARDPVGGFRPSAGVLLGSLARSGLPVVGGLLPGTGADGAKGLQILSAAKGRSFVQVPADYEPSERYEAVRALGFDVAELKQDAVASWILETTAAKPAAA